MNTPAEIWMDMGFMRYPLGFSILVIAALT